MTQPRKNCFICDQPMGPGRTGAYRNCSYCGHQILNDLEQSGIVVNETLDKSAMNRTTGLDRFKNSVLESARRRGGAEALLDLGSGSGKFLYQNRAKFQRVAGIEVSEASADFAREQLGLDIQSDLSGISPPLSVVTAWHSLEHIPAQQLDGILADISKRLDMDGVVIASVPNASSWQLQLFGEMFAFHDVPNHLHQFTHRSLVLLMQRHGFDHVGSYFSAPYNLFGILQGLTNIATGTKNYLYYCLKRNQGPRHRGRELLHMTFVAMFIPVSIVLLAFEAIRPSKQGVITFCFKKH